MTSTHLEQFRDAIYSAGLPPPDHIDDTGKLRRFPTNGKAGDKSGWYILHGDGIPAGAFGDWRTDLSQTWRADLGRALTAEEAEAYRAKVEDIRQARQLAEDQARRTAASRARRLFEQAAPATTHPYLTKKAVKAYGARTDGENLLIPMMDVEAIHSLQTITPSGEKRFLPGGRIKGCRYVIGQIDDAPALCIAEGFATGASIHEATGLPIVVAFFANNLAEVARAVRREHPAKSITICADDDHKTDGNPGRTKAEEAARAVGGRLAVPVFGPGRAEGDTDFNDLHRAQGLEAVRMAIEAAAIQMEEAKAMESDKANHPPPVELLRFSLEDLDRANLTPRCIVEKYLYADVAVLAAAGGTGKTTLSIYEAVHIVLGRPLYGLRVANFGAVLFVTAEDRREIFAARLRELMDAMELDNEERRRVLDQFLVWDVAGLDLRLTHVVDNMIVLTTLADRVIEAYRSNPPVMIVFDPLISFGADEGRINANEQALITAARRIVAGLSCCVRLVAHTGKANAREGALDQYGFRGGSALADGSRMMTILQPWKPDQPTGGPTPPATLATSARSSITILSRAKLSYCEPQPLLWLARDGWTFDYAVNVRTSPDEAKRARQGQLLNFITDQTKQGRHHTKSSLESFTETIGMSRGQLRGALAELLLERQVVEVPLPKDEQCGAKKTFFCPSNLAGALGEIPAESSVPGNGISPDQYISPPYRNIGIGEISPLPNSLGSSVSRVDIGEIGEIGEIAQGEPLEMVREIF